MRRGGRAARGGRRRPARARARRGRRRRRSCAGRSRPRRCSTPGIARAGEVRRAARPVERRRRNGSRSARPPVGDEPVGLPPASRAARSATRGRSSRQARLNWRTLPKPAAKRDLASREIGVVEQSPREVGARRARQAVRRHAEVGGEQPAQMPRRDAEPGAELASVPPSRAPSRIKLHRAADELRARQSSASGERYGRHRRHAR